MILGSNLNFVIAVVMVTTENRHYHVISKETFYSKIKNDQDTIFSENVHYICKNNLIERKFGLTFFSVENGYFTFFGLKRSFFFVKLIVKLAKTES